MLKEQVFCTECGTELRGAKFCPECGALTANRPAGAAAADGVGAATATAVRPAVGTSADRATATTTPPPDAGGVVGGRVPPGPGAPPEGGGAGARFPRRLVIGIAAGVAVIALIAASILLLGGGGPSHQSSTVTSENTISTTTGAKTADQPRTLAPVTKGEALALADEYAAAYSAESVKLLRSLLAPGFQRKNASSPTENRAQALATYASQFEGLSNPHYNLSNVSITTGRDTASVLANYRITSSAGTAKGFVVMEMARVNGKLLIRYINATPKGGTSSPGGSPAGDAGSSSGGASGASGRSNGSSSGSGGSSGGSSSGSGDGGGLLWYGYHLPPPTVPDLY